MFDFSSAVDLPLIWGLLIATAIFLYVLLDGFDLGIGILFPFAPSDSIRDHANGLHRWVYAPEGPDNEPADRVASPEAALKILAAAYAVPCVAHSIKGQFFRNVTTKTSQVRQWRGFRSGFA